MALEWRQGVGYVAMVTKEDADRVSSRSSSTPSTPKEVAKEGDKARNDGRDRDRHGNLWVGGTWDDMC